MAQHYSGTGMNRAQHAQVQAYVGDIRFEISKASADLAGIGRAGFSAIAKGQKRIVAESQRTQQAIAAEGEATREVTLEGFTALGRLTAEGFGRLHTATERLHTATQEGLATIHFDLRDNITELRHIAFVAERGLGNIEAQLGSLATSLADLIRIAKTPEQTWAYEQYGIAVEAFRRRLHADAFENVARAIAGHGSHTGYKIEHRFHQLLALIHATAPDDGILDLDKAEACYLVASNYAKAAGETEGAGYSLLRAAQFAYGRGDAGVAEARSRQALSLSATGEAHFLLAKYVLANGGNMGEVLGLVEEAIRINPDFFLLAAARHPDGGINEFLQHEEEVLQRATRIRDECILQASASVSHATNFMKLAEEIKGLYRDHFAKTQQLMETYGRGHGETHERMRALSPGDEAVASLNAEIPKASTLIAENSLFATKTARDRALPVLRNLADAAKKHADRLVEAAGAGVDMLRTLANARVADIESHREAETAEMISAGERESNSVHVPEIDGAGAIVMGLGLVASFGFAVFWVSVVLPERGMGTLLLGILLFLCILGASLVWGEAAPQQAADRRKVAKQQSIRVDLDRRVAMSRQRQREEVEQARAKGNADVKELEVRLAPITNRSDTLNRMLEEWAGESRRG